MVTSLYLKKLKIYLKISTKNTISSDKKIIFIIGMPRSGTILAEQILSAHKDVYGAGELKDFKRIY